jgi:hypothetical protein
VKRKTRAEIQLLFMIDSAEEDAFGGKAGSQIQRILKLMG